MRKKPQKTAASSGGMSSIKTVQQRSKKLNGRRQKDNSQRTVNSKKSKLTDMQKGERYITITFRKIRENPPKLENTKEEYLISKILAQISDTQNTQKKANER